MASYIEPIRFALIVFPFSRIGDFCYLFLFMNTESMERFS